jgi:hypothetical protein
VSKAVLRPAAAFFWAFICPCGRAASSLSRTTCEHSPMHTSRIWKCTLCWFRRKTARARCAHIPSGACMPCPCGGVTVAAARLFAEFWVSCVGTSDARSLACTSRDCMRQPRAAVCDAWSGQLLYSARARMRAERCARRMCLFSCPGAIGLCFCGRTCSAVSTVTACRCVCACAARLGLNIHPMDAWECFSC